MFMTAGYLQNRLGSKVIKSEDTVWIALGHTGILFPLNATIEASDENGVIIRLDANITDVENRLAEAKDLRVQQMLTDP